MYNVIITALLIASFFMCICAYSFGVKHGRIVSGGGVPNVNPIKAVEVVKAEKQAKQQMDVFAEGLQNIMNFGEPIKPMKEKG